MSSLPLRYIPRFMRPWFLPVLTVIAIIALFAAVVAVIRANEIQRSFVRANEVERIEADTVSCVAGNAVRADILAGFVASDAVDDALIEALIASAPPGPRVDQFAGRIAPARAKTDELLAGAFKPRDCSQIQSEAQEDN